LAAIPAPIRFARDLADGKGLEPLGPWPTGIRIAGAEPALVKTWFEGQIAVQVCQIPDGVLRYPRTPFDEIVIVLEGRATVTPDGGVAEIFDKGEVFILPEGFEGTFAVSDGYRELTVMETRVMRALAAEWGVSV
jgi:hypothetical protein